jgi:hypothetical protein
MGMDVFGIAPVDDSGRYFRASIWEWRPLCERMKELCGDFLSEELMAAMAFNDGAGPQDQSTCNMIADRLEQWLLANSDEEYSLDSNASQLCVLPGGRLVLRDQLTTDHDAIASPYKIRREEIAKFIVFLRNCGGFGVC